MSLMPVQINKPLLTEILVRFFLWMSFIWFDHSAPFIREIKPEELWIYQYPTRPSYVSTSSLWLIVFGVPLTILFINYLATKDHKELTQSILCMTLNFGLNGFLTCFLKVIIGRPRPDFYYRCFPDGKGTDMKSCTGDPGRVADGRKSFPSGHSSFAFASMVFCMLFLFRKLRTFDSDNRGDGLRFCASVAPLLVAVTIATSRTCDYHHHWQDVLAGSILGTSIAIVTYKLHFPAEASPTDTSYSAVQNLH